MPHLEALRDMGLDVYGQCTLKDYEAEGLEPGLPSLRRRMDIFARLNVKRVRQTRGMIPGCNLIYHTVTIKKN